MDILDTNLFSLFENSIESHVPEDSKKVLYLDKEIERPEYSYIWNYDGLRSVNFSVKPKIIALGCSFTMGAGLPIEHTWPYILQSKYNDIYEKNIEVGVIAYSGGSIMKAISSFFSIIKKYDYIPEYVVANFPGLDRFYFIDGKGECLSDYSSQSYKARRLKDSYPYTYNEMLPHEWVYYINLEYIKMLELFCKHSGIKLVWSTWSRHLGASGSSNFEDKVNSLFDYYIDDITRSTFYGAGVQEYDSLLLSENIEFPESYAMKNWESIRCHEDDEKQVGSYRFNVAYDDVLADPKNPYSMPHVGLHRQIHWAEMYLDEIIKHKSML